jgi:small multidrug resistance pump
MIGYLLLAGGIVCEMGGTLSLRVAVRGRRAFYALVLLGYTASFVFLSLCLEQGVGIGVAYGIWAAVGIALTAVASRLLFSEPLTRVMAGGIGLISAGVVLIEVGTQR